MAYYTAGLVGPYIRNAVTPSTFDISGGNISVTGTVSANTLSVAAFAPSNLAVPGYIRNDVSGSTTDISGGNIRITGALSAGSITGSVTSTNLVVPGYIRDALTPTTLDISGGNISNSGTTTSTNAIVSGYVRNALAPTQFDISGGNISNSGTSRSANVIASGYIRNALTPTTLDISSGNVKVSGGVYASNVGVGTTDTTYALDVCGTTFTAALRNPSGNAQLFFAGDDVAPANGLQIYHNIGEQGAYLNNTNKFIIRDSLENPLFTVDPATGYVGINKSDPGFTFDVNGGIRGTSFNMSDAYVSNQLSMASGDVDKIYFTTQNATGPRITHSSGWNLNAFAGSNGNTTGNFTFNHGIAGGTTVESMRITSNRQVGIGRTTPGYVLDISSSTNFDGIRIVAPGPVINMYDRATGEAVSNTLQVFANSSNGGFHQFGSTRSINFLTNSASRMAIGSNGLVAIGSGFSNPEYALDVCSSSTQATAVFRNSSSGQAAIWVTSGAGATYSSGLELYQDSTTQGLYTSSANTLPVTIWTKNARRVTIDQSGNMGIGNTNPVYRLDVTSDATSKASVNMTTWSRTTISNALVRRIQPTRVGNTFNMSNTGTTLDTNLITWNYSNGTTGSSFIILKSGIWSIQAQMYGTAAGAYAWIDSSTNDVATVAFETAGSTYIAFGGNNAGGIFNLTFTGYIPSNSSVYYKLRGSGDLSITGGRVNGNILHMTFLQEMPDAVAGFPNF